MTVTRLVVVNGEVIRIPVTTDKRPTSLKRIGDALAACSGK